MNEVMETAKVLRAYPDLLGWVIFVAVVTVVIAQHKRILAYFDARIDSYTSKKQSDAVIAELIRNNTSALDNNTATLSLIQQDRYALIEKIDYHESMNCERMAHIQTVVNRIDSTVKENHEDIMLIADRTKKGE